MAVPGHHPGPQEGEVSPLLLFMDMTPWHGSQRHEISSRSWLGIGDLDLLWMDRNRTRGGLGVGEGVMVFRKLAAWTYHWCFWRNPSAEMTAYALADLYGELQRRG